MKKRKVPLTVTRSYRLDTTKGGHADVIPIATELMPYLEDAIASSLLDGSSAPDADDAVVVGVVDVTNR